MNGRTDDRPDWARRLAESPGDLIPLRPTAPAPAEEGETSGEPVGFLVVDKPAGMSSHDVVSAVRKASSVRRVGHAGTLDPMATGVLVVGIGSATRLLDAVQGTAKSYRATLRLGVATDTYDADGKVVGRTDPSGVSRDAFEAALAAYLGPIEQRPPMYSAVRHQGRKLYELARKGVEVERAPRPVAIHEIRLEAWSPPDAEIHLTASAGTYVRSLAHDLGADLGVGAHVAALRRTAVGRFQASDAVPLPRAVEALAEGWWDRLVLPMDAALLELPALIVGSRAEADIRHGRAFKSAALGSPPAGTVRVYASDGRFVATARWDDVDGRWLPERVFASAP
jgi:tRNA pseudouridine55 synthase